MITAFCVFVLGAWPHELGVPPWFLVLSLLADLTLPAILKSNPSELDKLIARKRMSKH